MSRENECPYCGSDEKCKHLLLIVDLTFREAGSGVLYEEFTKAWNKITDNYEDTDFDESEEFNKLLEDVEDISEATSYEVIEGGPGMSSEYAIISVLPKK